MSKIDLIDEIILNCKANLMPPDLVDNVFISLATKSIPELKAICFELHIVTK